MCGRIGTGLLHRARPRYTRYAEAIRHLVAIRIGNTNQIVAHHRANTGVIFRTIGRGTHCDTKLDTYYLVPPHGTLKQSLFFLERAM